MSGVSSKWTPDRIVEAARLWNEDKSATEVALSFNVTRNSIIGLAHRRPDLFKTKMPGVNKGRVPTRPNRNTGLFRRSKPLVVKTDTPPDMVEEPVVPAVIGAVFDAGRLPFAKPLHELGACECKWPVTVSSPHRFCAEEATGIYCDHHYMRAHAPRASIMRAAA